MNPGGDKEMTEAVHGAINDLAVQVAAEAKIELTDLLEIVLVGNPVMHHLLLGIDPTELGGNPWSAAATSFALFATGAIFPVLPYLWNSSSASVVMSASLSALVLAGIGMLTSLFNGRSVSYSALRQVAFGCLAAAVTFGVGRLLGVSLA